MVRPANNCLSDPLLESPLGSKAPVVGAKRESAMLGHDGGCLYLGAPGIGAEPPGCVRRFPPRAPHRIAALQGTMIETTMLIEGLGELGKRVPLV